MDDNTDITIESYDKTVKDYVRLVDSLYPQKESKKFISLIKENSLILDLGCGPGRDSKIFSNKGYKVIGVDLSKEMIKVAKQRVKTANFKVMDLRNMSFKDNYFDAIWANAIFMHISKKEISQAIKETLRILKKDGILYISIKEGKGEELLPDKRYGGVKKFWSFYQKNEFEKLLNESGFTILDSYIEKQDSSYATHPWIYIFCKK